MNGGGNATDPQHNPLALALGFPTSGLTVFDPMQFRAIQNSIQDVRAKLDAMEEQSRIGLANYELKVRLEEEAEKGRRAEYVQTISPSCITLIWSMIARQALKALERGQVPVYTERPPVPGPSTAMHSGANYTMPPHVYPVPPQFAAPASPPQARIEEVTGSPNAVSLQIIHFHEDTFTILRPGALFVSKFKIFDFSACLHPRHSLEIKHVHSPTKRQQLCPLATVTTMAGLQAG